MASVVEEICNLQIHLIDAGWAEAIYEADFLEFGDLPTEFENNLENFDLQENFLATIKSIDRWLRPGVETDEERSWITLSQLIPYKKLVALLAYYINYGCKNVQNSDLMTYALLASRVYYKLLSIPGYKGYHIYHSQLFANSLACLGLPRVMSEQESFFNARELTREVNAVIKELRFFIVDLRTTVQILKLTPNDLNFEDILSSLVEVTGGGVANRLNVGM